MTNAGAFSFPARNLDDCLSYLRTARDKLRSRSMTRERFAQALGQSPLGGGFGKLVGSMTAYGLVETGGGKISTTEMGEQILFGDSTEQRQGREMSIRSIRLFDELLKKYGSSPSDEQLRIFLREKAGVELSQTKAVAAEVGKLLRKNSVHISAARGSRTQSSETVSRKSLGELVGRLEMADYGILNIRDEISMDLAMNLLAQVKKVRGWGSLAPAGQTQSPSRPEKTLDGEQATGIQPAQANSGPTIEPEPQSGVRPVAQSTGRTRNARRRPSSSGSGTSS